MITNRSTGVISYKRKTGSVIFDIRQIGKVCQVNNSDTFNGKPIGSEEFLNQMVEVLEFTIDTRLSKERTRDRMCP